MTKFYLDTEFNGHGGVLLSLALVPDKERDMPLYLVNKDASGQDVEPWVRENVLTVMHPTSIKLPMAVTKYVPLDVFGWEIKQFIGLPRHPEIIADSPVDIGRFCDVLSTGTDGGWASADYPRMTFRVHNVDCYPTTLPGAVQHNALWDALALKHKLESQ